MERDSHFVGVLVVSNSVPATLLRRQPHAYLPFTSTCPVQLARRVLDIYFPHLRVAELSCAFVDSGPLAWSCWRARSGVLDIRLHNVLNHADTPDLVLEYLVKHELLHLCIEPLVDEDDEVERHPPEFIERERVISPERLVAWTWLYVALGEHLRVRPQAQRVDVASTWKAAWHLPRPDVAGALRMRHRFTRPARRYL